MTPREERLLRIEARAERRRKRRNATWHVACGFGRTERMLYWLNLRREADALLARLFMARVEAGVRRWQADDAAQVLRAVE